MTDKSSFKSRRRAWILKAGKRSRKFFNRMMIGSSTLGDPEVFDDKDFPWVATLLENIVDIQEELSRLLSLQDRLPGIEEISPDHARIALDKKWRSVFLHAYGYRSDVICRLCPRTASLVDRLPGIETAFFSVLTPGAYLPPHKGVTKAILTCHIPLRVPADEANCWIRVNETRHHWRLGKPFIFDDTRQHEVHNDTDEARVVLLIHVRRPARFPGSLVGHFFMWAVKASPFVKDGIKNQQAWEQEFARMYQNYEHAGEVT